MSIKYTTTGYGGRIGHWIPDGEYVNSIEEADLVMVPGGSDIDPRIYGETVVHPRSWGYTRMESDDTLKRILKAIELKKHIFGICKGIQYGCAVSGGKLVQDISHPGSHPVHTRENISFNVNSMHHQMCYPFNLPKKDYQILAWADKLSDRHEDGSQKQMSLTVEPEFLHFKKTRFLGTKYHPEAMPANSKALEFTLDTLYSFLKNKL
jgi:gamma-glutamyl-gamma-aminobutyrate hydrolase PuuD